MKTGNYLTHPQQSRMQPQQCLFCSFCCFTDLLYQMTAMSELIKPFVKPYKKLNILTSNLMHIQSTTMAKATHEAHKLSKIIQPRVTDPKIGYFPQL